MEMALVACMLLCYLIGAIGAIWLLVEAFRLSAREGVQALFAPYMLYFAFVKLRHPRKALIPGLWLAGGCAGIILNIILAAEYD